MARRSKKEIDAIIARGDFLRELLGEFGARLSGWDPGVLATWQAPEYGAYVPLDFTRGQWAWLEPLLVELRDLREKVSAAKDGSR